MRTKINAFPYISLKTLPFMLQWRKQKCDKFEYKCDSFLCFRKLEGLKVCPNHTDINRGSRGAVPTNFNQLKFHNECNQFNVISLKFYTTFKQKPVFRSFYLEMRYTLLELFSSAP